MDHRQFTLWAMHFDGVVHMLRVALKRVPDREEEATVTALEAVLPMSFPGVPPQAGIGHKRPVACTTLEVFLGLVFSLDVGRHHILGGEGFVTMFTSHTVPLQRRLASVWRALGQVRVAGHHVLLRVLDGFVTMLALSSLCLMSSLDVQVQVSW